MCQVYDPAALREVVLCALPAAAPELREELFADDEVVWHRQQLGLPGHVAVADLVVAGRDLYVTVMFSDVVQRISRRRGHKTQVEETFKGWARVLLNGIMEYALDSGFAVVHVPTATLAVANTDPQRTVGRDLFERIYDRTVNTRFEAARSAGWWKIGVRENESRVAPLTRRITVAEREATICIAHDIERGAGHLDVDPVFAARADRSSPGALDDMQVVEAEHGVRATYCVVGAMLNEVRGGIEAGGHAIGFHSYEHVLPATPTRWGRLRARFVSPDRQRRDATTAPDFRELVRCREVDYRIKGYRPPRSLIGPGLADRHLSYFNFEWLASSCSSLGTEDPVGQNGIVKIPVHLDDHDLHVKRLDYVAWEARVLAAAAAHHVTVIALHDCYAEHWAARYPSLLEKLGMLGVFRTLDEVCDDVMLGQSLWCDAEESA